MAVTHGNTTAAEEARQRKLRQRNLLTGWILAAVALLIMLSVGFFRLAG